jgi:hypothetical protein
LDTILLEDKGTDRILFEMDLRKMCCEDENDLK